MLNVINVRTAHVMKGKSLMSMIQPKATVMWKTKEDALNDMKHLEMIGRVCYKSEDKITEDSYEKFLKMLISKGHESVLEHVTATARITCDRGVSHELVRHRIGAFTQESTRYCNYKYDMTFIPASINPETSEGQKAVDIMIESFIKAKEDYQKLLELGCTPELARSILPMKLKTEMFITFNLRQWRHFFKLRMTKAAHPDMRYIAYIIYQQLSKLYPIIFEDMSC